MYNPNSAIDRIKNSLSYKLGFAIIEHKKQHGGGYITLPYKLYKIKQQHKKDQKLYKQTIKIFPYLAYPKVESCKDYNESIKYKYHLSYMLGEALIKAHKTWYKGGYFKLSSLLKEKYKLYKNIQNIINILPQNLHYHFYNSTIKNHKINIQDLIDILKQHKDYKPILENIFHNFDFFIKHFDLINIWLSSNDFKEKYKQENHPYPSLLDPKKLNDQNEKINYKSIPAELAWEMNLPLPRTYRFVFITGGSCGHMAMFLYFKVLQINRNWTSSMEEEKYKIAYNIFSTSKEYNIFSCQWSQTTKKLFYLVDAEVPLVVLLRDPIERLKSLTNHIEKHIAKFDLTFNPEEVLANKYYKMRDYPSLEKIDTIINIPNYFDIFQKVAYFKNITEIITLDIKDIIGDKCYRTFCNLSKKLNFNYPGECLKEIFITPFVSKVMDMLPLTLVLYPTNQDNEKNKANYPIEIIITFKKMMLYCNQEKLLDMKKKIFFKNNWDIQDEILFLINKSDKDRFLDDYCLFLHTQEYLEKFMTVFENKVKKERKKLFNENDILNYLKRNKQIRTQLKKALHAEICFIKNINQNIITSWKYYQEFERMCKELDGD
ncbi:DUF2972 domain-containing protein [Campylobacter sp. IFREMER_LSEM_CL1085]|uniref:DUF2972 domain-containing protein n=1 Tax=Campylobacter sp. IFREMER_LSEM_CL1085 TaxID=2911612 RepID=UPI0039949DB2